MTSVLKVDTIQNSSGVTQWFTNPPRFHARMETATSHADIAFAVAVCDAEDIDSENAYDTSTGIFTVPQDGTYYFYASLLIDGSTDTTNRDSWGAIQVSTDGGTTYTVKSSAGSRWGGSTDIRSASATPTLMISLNSGDKVRPAGLCNTSDSSTWYFIPNVESEYGYGVNALDTNTATFFGGYRIA